jgi:hypothetical protein
MKWRGAFGAPTGRASVVVFPLLRDAPPLNQTFGSPGPDLRAVLAKARLDENEHSKAETREGEQQ